MLTCFLFNHVWWLLAGVVYAVIYGVLFIKPFAEIIIKSLVQYKLFRITLIKSNINPLLHGMWRLFHGQSV